MKDQATTNNDESAVVQPNANSRIKASRQAPGEWITDESGESYIHDDFRGKECCLCDGWGCEVCNDSGIVSQNRADSLLAIMERETFLLRTLEKLLEHPALSVPSLRKFEWSLAQNNLAHKVINSWEESGMVTCQMLRDVGAIWVDEDIPCGEFTVVAPHQPLDVAGIWADRHFFFEYFKSQVEDWEFMFDIWESIELREEQPQEVLVESAAE